MVPSFEYLFVIGAVREIISILLILFTIPSNKKSRTISLECLSIINPGTPDSKSQEFQLIEALIKFQLSIFHSVPGTAPSKLCNVTNVSDFIPFIWNLPLPITL